MAESGEVRTRKLETGERPLFTRDDASFLIEFPVLLGTAALVREERWRDVMFQLERLKSRIGRFSLDKIRRGLGFVRGDAGGPDDAIRIAATRSEHHIQIIRDYFFGWSAPTELSGAENVHNALAAGKGAVLWVAHFSFNSLASKKAMHQAGFQVSHLSRPEHGFSKSRFGIAVLNPLRVKAELRYLKGRIIIERTKPAAAVTRAQRELRDNGIVSITAGAWEGAKVATVEIKGCTLDLSTGAPGLAAMTGATLLPVFTVREAGERTIRVVVGEPIPTERGATRDEKVAIATQVFADRLTPYVDTYPIQWRDWEKIRPKLPVKTNEG